MLFNISFMRTKEELAHRIEEITGWKTNLSKFKIVTDTSDWMNIYKGDIIRLDCKDFLVRGNMREPRFGIDDQPKYWVFSAIDLDNKEEKIIKTVFHEEFIAHIGILKIRCYRSPEKESEILQLVRGDNRFMQGYMCNDEKGNNIRIIDYIKGVSFFQYIPSIKKQHYQYFVEDLPQILKNLLPSIEAIQFLHDNKLCHGDIRNDHIFIESESGLYRWIDFDLKQDITDFDLWSMGNILSYTVGKGIITFSAIQKSEEYSNEIKNSLSYEDSSAFYSYRIMNLKKIFPYIPENLSKILRKFTIKPLAYYQNLKEFIDDYKNMLAKDFNLL